MTRPRPIVTVHLPAEASLTVAVIRAVTETVPGAVVLEPEYAYRDALVIGLPAEPEVAPAPSELLARSHDIAGVVPDGEARTAGDMAAFMSGEDEEPAPDNPAPQRTALTHSDASPRVRIAGTLPIEEDDEQPVAVVNI